MHYYLMIRLINFNFIKTKINISKFKQTKLFHFKYMAQLDSLIIFPLLWSLLFVLVIYYSISIKKLIPSFFETKKFRKKKLNSPEFYSFRNNLKLTNSYNIF